MARTQGTKSRGKSAGKPAKKATTGKRPGGAAKPKPAKRPASKPSPKPPAKKAVAKKSPKPKAPAKKSAPAKAVAKAVVRPKVPAKAAAKTAAPAKPRTAPATHAAIPKAPAAAPRPAVEKKSAPPAAVSHPAPVSKPVAPKAPAAPPLKSFPAAGSNEGARVARAPIKPLPVRRGGREMQRVGEAREAISPEARNVFTPAFLEKQRSKLLVKKEEILAMYKKDLQSGQESNDSPTEDIVDRANNAYSRELAFSISDNERELMLQIDQAIARIHAGTYGFCLHTGQPIGIARLEALPWAKYGVEAQEMLEKGLLSEA